MRCKCISRVKARPHTAPAATATPRQAQRLKTTFMHQETAGMCPAPGTQRCHNRTQSCFCHNNGMQQQAARATTEEHHVNPASQALPTHSRLSDYALPHNTKQSLDLTKQTPTPCTYHVHNRQELGMTALRETRAWNDSSARPWEMTLKSRPASATQSLYTTQSNAVKKTGKRQIEKVKEAKAHSCQHE